MISRYQKTKGFTLIELLVVISIISLLSNIVLSSVSSARDKARIAAGKQFDSHNFSGFAADALGIWNFEETSGTTIADKSQYLNNLTLLNGPTFVSGGIRGNAYNFDGTNDYAISSILPSTIPGVTGTDWTLSVWINPSNITGWRAFFSLYSPDLYIALVNGRFYFFWRTVTSNASAYETASGAREINKWYHVALTHNDSATETVLYVNGTEAGRESASNSYSILGRTVYFGRYGPGGSNYAGLIDEVRIYSNALIASNIRQLYAEGLPRHTLAEAN